MAELHRLKERVAVLERLMTDEIASSAGEIERLRGEERDANGMRGEDARR